MKTIHRNLTFKKLSKGENLYDDAPITEQDVVPAQYYKRRGFENNPDVCAIPVLHENEVIEDVCRSIVPGTIFEKEELAQMSAAEKIDAALLIREIPFPLYPYYSLAKEINHDIVFSYKSRRIRSSCTQLDPKVSDEHDINTSVTSEVKPMAARPLITLVVGQSGSGKTFGMQIIKSMYPTAIRHSFPDLSYIQIPMIYVSGYLSDLRGVLRSIMMEIDKTLETGNYYASRITNGIAIGKACEILQEVICMLHIGVIVIDECEYLNYGNQATSFENLLTIQQKTGVGFVLIGNHEAYERIQQMPRFATRALSHTIIMDEVSKKNCEFFEDAIEYLWMYQYTDRKYPLTKSMKDQIIAKTGYNISLLKALLCKIQHKLIMAEAKGEDTKVNAKFIGDTAGVEFRRMRNLLAASPNTGGNIPENEQKLQEIMQAIFERIGDDIKPTEDDGITLSYTDSFEIRKLCARVDTVVSYKTGRTETECGRIRKTLFAEMPDLYCLDEADIIDKVVAKIEQADEQAKRKLSKDRKKNRIPIEDKLGSVLDALK